MRENQQQSSHWRPYLIDASGHMPDRIGGWIKKDPERPTPYRVADLGFPACTRAARAIDEDVVIDGPNFWNHARVTRHGHPVPNRIILMELFDLRNELPITVEMQTLYTTYGNDVNEQKRLLGAAQLLCKSITLDEIDNHERLVVSDAPLTTYDGAWVTFNDMQIPLPTSGRIFGQSHEGELIVRHLLIPNDYTIHLETYGLTLFVPGEGELLAFEHTLLTRLMRAKPL